MRCAPHGTAWDRTVPHYTARRRIQTGNYTLPYMRCIALRCRASCGVARHIATCGVNVPPLGVIVTGNRPRSRKLSLNVYEFRFMYTFSKSHDGRIPIYTAHTVRTRETLLIARGPGQRKRSPLHPQVSHGSSGQIYVKRNASTIDHRRVKLLTTLNHYISDLSASCRLSSKKNSG